MKNCLNRKKGFTIVELLVAIAIIGVLAASSIYSTVRARALANETKAKGDLKALRDAVNLLVADVGKWPGGCPVDKVSNPEIDLSIAQAGIKQSPVVGIVDSGSGCFWTAQDVANWKGPYAQYSLDPWGSAYYFDPDYEPWLHCSGKTALAKMPVVMSPGTNKSDVNAYDCDDFYLPLR
ncbi:MAG: prepilin-type N-terminal cleavage/methylation domain-containing protein [Patescibacteria group bacterium]|nr:prepilin-type N-terminal cleavage/methylation domain-containing protein [Patescibacteria group bacterium]